MKNTRARGKLLVKRVKEILEADGYLVQTCNPKLMFIGHGKIISKGEDFFGRFDMICVAKASSPKFIQVSVWEKLSEKIKQVSGFPHGPYSQEIWLWFFQGKNSHFRVCKSPLFKWEGECRMPIISAIPHSHGEKRPGGKKIPSFSLAPAVSTVSGGRFKRKDGKVDQESPSRDLGAISERLGGSI